MLSLYDLSRSQLAEQISAWGFAAVHAQRLWRYLYRERTTSFADMNELPARLRTRLESAAVLPQPTTTRETRSADGSTHKFLLQLQDGREIETVLMRYEGRVTACVSSQVGCALGCVFCATGRMGWERNLSVGEIVTQALHVARAAEAGERLRNIVLMGMGEPLQNYDAVAAAIEILRDPGGPAIGGKQITLSTAGVVPGIVRMADEGLACSLAVSLHAATQDERAELVPAARAWPLDDLMDACRYYTKKLDRRVFFEWTLIADKNDSPEQARALARLLRGMAAHVNIIPLNPTVGYDGQPGRTEAVDRFHAILREHGLPVTVRQRRGIEIDAGCGQLISRAARETRSTPRGKSLNRVD